MNNQTTKALWQYQCKATPKTASRLAADEAKSLLLLLSDWHIVDCETGQQLKKSFSFSNFVEAIRFADTLSEVAEANDHHPALLVEYGKVTVSWWSHSIGGLHHNDFVLAAKTDRAYLIDDR